MKTERTLSLNQVREFIESSTEIGFEENPVSLNLHLIDSTKRGQSRVAQFSWLYGDAKKDSFTAL